MPNNQTLLIRNAKVVNEGQIKTLDLFVDGVFISKIAPQIDDVADVEINAMGKLFCLDSSTIKFIFVSLDSRTKEQYKQKAVKVAEALPPFLKCKYKPPNDQLERISK